MVATQFAWFVITLIVTLSNIVLSIYVFYELDKEKKLRPRLRDLKHAAMFYAVGMMIALILAVSLFVAADSF